MVRFLFSGRSSLLRLTVQACLHHTLPVLNRSAMFLKTDSTYLSSFSFVVFWYCLKHVLLVSIIGSPLKMIKFQHRHFIKLNLNLKYQFSVTRQHFLYIFRLSNCVFLLPFPSPSVTGEPVSGGRVVIPARYESN